MGSKQRICCDNKDNSNFTVSRASIIKSMRSMSESDRVSSEHTKDLRDKKELILKTREVDADGPRYAKLRTNDNKPGCRKSRAGSDASGLDSPKTKANKSKCPNLCKDNKNPNCAISNAKMDEPILPGECDESSSARQVKSRTDRKSPAQTAAKAGIASSISDIDLKKSAKSK